jgi:hypothetical protein
MRNHCSTDWDFRNLLPVPGPMFGPITARSLSRPERPSAGIAASNLRLLRNMRIAYCRSHTYSGIRKKHAVRSTGPGSRLEINQ